MERSANYTFWRASENYEIRPSTLYANNGTVGIGKAAARIDLKLSLRVTFTFREFLLSVNKVTPVRWPMMTQYYSTNTLRNATSILDAC